MRHTPVREVLYGRSTEDVYVIIPVLFIYADSDWRVFG
jgi:hypothetical protein